MGVGPGPGIGVGPAQTALITGRGQVSEGVLCVVSVQTVTGTATYNLYDANGAPYPMRIVRIWGICTDGAPGAGDTVVVQRVTTSANAITETADLQAAGLGDTDVFDMARLDDAQWLLNPGDGLRVVTASDATCMLYVEYIKNSETN